jgi:hypothetical protein
MINSITKLLINETPSPTMTRNTRNQKFKANNNVSKAPVATSKTVRVAKPKYSTKQGATVITHREYIGPVTANVTTNIDSYFINPGLQSVFPWLSGISSGYERYKFTKLEFTYVSAAATSERGRVALSYQYDPTGDSPVSRAQMFSIVPNVEEAPWEDIVLRVKPLNEFRYIRQGVISTGGTYNTYDCGKFHTLTAMNADNTTQLGELFVEYSVILENPQFQNTNIAGYMTATGETAAAPFGTSIDAAGGMAPFTWVSGTQIAFNTQLPLLIVFVFTGTGLAQTSATLTLKSGSNGSITTYTNTVNTAGTSQVNTFITKFTQPGDTITLIGSESTTLTAFSLRVALYSEQ